jgi:hypothetical protein
MTKEMDTRKQSKGRRVFLINPRFQLLFLGFMVGIAALAILIFYGSNLYFLSEFTRNGQALGLPPDHVYFEFLNAQRQLMTQIFSLTSGICIGVMSLGGLLFSHRVAGPLYRLHRHMLDVAAGRTSDPVKFRRGDFFPEVAEAYNEQLKALKGAPPVSTDRTEVARDEVSAA